MELHATKLGCLIDNLPLFEGIDLSLREGEAVFLSGVNGSGKSTLLRMLCGLRWPDLGEIRWNGANIRQDLSGYQSGLSYLGHRDGIKDDLTVYENLTLGGLRTLPGEEEILAHLQAMGLQDSSELLGRQLSAGQRRRLALIRVMLSGSHLWLLDEPFTALDQQGCEYLEQRLRQHLHMGGMLIFTSHHWHGMRELVQQEIHLGHS